MDKLCIFFISLERLSTIFTLMISYDVYSFRLIYDSLDMYRETFTLISLFTCIISLKAGSTPTIGGDLLKHTLYHFDTLCSLLVTK